MGLAKTVNLEGWSNYGILIINKTMTELKFGKGKSVHLGRFSSYGGVQLRRCVVFNLCKSMCSKIVQKEHLSKRNDKKVYGGSVVNTSV